MPLPSADWLSQLWPLAVMAVVVGWFVRRGTQRRVDAQRRANAQAAEGRGLSYRAPGGEGALAAEGIHQYGGRTDGIDWTAEVLVLPGQHHVDPDRTPMGRVPYTRWTAASCRTAVAGGGALALMSTPPGASPDAQAAAPGRLLEGLKARAGGLALQAWLALSFGPARVAGLPLTPAHARTIDAGEFGQRWRVFTDRAELLACLTPAARDWLMRGGDRKLQVLWDDRGLTLMWPAAKASPEQVRSFADDGIALWHLLRGEGGAPPSAAAATGR